MILKILPSDRLRDKLIVINGKPFQAYQELAGGYRFDRFVLYLDAIQTDPMAGATRARVRIDQAEAQVPRTLWDSPPRRMAARDYLARAVHEAIRRHVRTRWTGRTPPLAVDAGSQAVLPRTACTMEEDWVEVRLAVGLPAEGRKALAKAAQQLFFDELPLVVDAGLMWANLNADGARRHVETVEDYLALRESLPHLGLVAFIADGSVLPREAASGDGPMRGGRAQPIRAPEELAVIGTLPHRGPVRGLGIRRGVTVVAGGAYSGKSTLLAAISRGVYPHIPGDGRELVATHPDAVVIRAEPGRRIERVDISAFIREVPGRPETTAFSVEHATGTTSTAAAVAEALEVGTRLLLFDEDDGTAAFLARDALMQQLIPRSRERLVRLIDVVRPLWESHGISSIVALSGLGDYLEVADTVIVMDGFQPMTATDRARSLVATSGGRRAPEGAGVGLPAPRFPQPRGFGGWRGRRLWSEVRGRGALGVGRETVDLAALAQMVDQSQARAAGDAILYALEKGYIDGNTSLVEALDRVFADIEASSLGVLAMPEGHPGEHAMPRRHEVAAILNRLRSLQVRARGAAPGAPGEPAPPGGVPGEETRVPEETGVPEDSEVPEEPALRAGPQAPAGPERPVGDP
ncbi:MAG: ABC-ATPase domain-containing protein [Armatimonadetes bacterium]|nr:ABC-ATPase domain-containing protein [Armatimonadota bacterium]